MKKIIIAFLTFIILFQIYPGLYIEASSELYTEVDELAGIEFDSYDKLLKFISENKGKSKIEDIDSAVSKFLLDSDSIYILDEYKDKPSEINKILITPTYISAKFVINDVNYSLYHYYSISSGEKQISEAEKYYNEKRYSAGTAFVKSNDVYFYERSLYDSKESYYVWKQSSNYFLLRVNRSINDADVELCVVKELSISNNQTIIKNKTGWQTIDGNKYFFKKDGTAVTKSCVINGIRYKFSSDGVCQGKYTGWTKSANGRRYYKNGVMLKERWIKTKSGKKYYAGEDGYMTTGWYRADNGWCYFNEKNGQMSTGDVKINGNTYTFSADGIWNGFADYDNTKIYNTLNKKLSKDDYGGIYLDKNAVVVMSKNDSAVKKHTDELKKLYAPIVIRECEHSVNELEAVREHLVKNQKKYGISAISTDVKNNRISVEIKKVTVSLMLILKRLIMMISFILSIQMSL